LLVVGINASGVVRDCSSDDFQIGLHTLPAALPARLCLLHLFLTIEAPGNRSRPGIERRNKEVPSKNTPLLSL
jgi:hypothetical protein